MPIALWQTKATEAENEVEKCNEWHNETMLRQQQLNAKSQTIGGALDLCGGVEEEKMAWSLQLYLFINIAQCIYLLYAKNVGRTSSRLNVTSSRLSILGNCCLINNHSNRWVNQTRSEKLEKEERKSFC